MRRQMVVPILFSALFGFCLLLWPVLEAVSSEQKAIDPSQGEIKTEEKSGDTEKTVSPFISYFKSGGIAGFEDYLEIDDQGWLKTNQASNVKAAKARKLDRETMQALRIIFSSKEWKSLEPEKPTPVVNDGITYSISTADKEVSRSDPLPHEPVFRQALSLLNKLLRDERQQVKEPAAAKPANEGAAQ